MYTLFVVLHIISVGVVIGLVTFLIIGRTMRKKVKGTMAEVAAIRSGAMIAPVMAMIGSNGLLVTGVVLTFMQYSFFPFGTFPWLAIKQSVFVVILLISFLSLMPRGKKILEKANAEIASPNAAQGASEELRTLVNKQFMTVMIVAVLVLINITLGESKDMMWLRGQ